jgi:hypothetical protein
VAFPVARSIELLPAGRLVVARYQRYDLYAVPGTPLLSFTTGRHCWRFDRDQRKFSPHPEIGDRAGAKCINTNPATGQIVWVLSEGGNWCTDKLRFLHPEATLQLPGERIYK